MQEPSRETLGRVLGDVHEENNDYEQEDLILAGWRLAQAQVPPPAGASTRILLFNIKEPDAFQEMCHTLDVSEKIRDKCLESGEYASLEIDVTPDLKIVGGRFLPRSEW